MRKRILVTGGAGFIGSHTVDLLLAKEKEVIVLDNLFSGRLENLPLQHPNLEFIEGDILEYPLVEELIRTVDAVLHLAAVTSVPLSIENPIYTFQINTQGFLHILEAVNKINSDVRIVYASSAAVYGEAETLPCDDALPLTGKVLSPYALQKINDEQYAELYARLYATKSLGLRYFNVYGERQISESPYAGVITRFLNLYKKDEELIIFGDGLQARDYVYVADVAHANLLALESDVTGVLNIGTGQPQTLLELIQCIEAVGKKPAKARYEEARHGDIKASYAAIHAAEKQLTFRASTFLQKGIELISL